MTNYSIEQKIMETLPEDLKKYFENLIIRLENAEVSLISAKAKLDGSWPYWEWMKKVRKQLNEIPFHKREDIIPILLDTEQTNVLLDFFAGSLDLTKNQLKLISKIEDLLKKAKTN